MTRKHYEAIARALAKTNASYATCNEVASEITQFNPSFDWARFMRKCGHIPVVEVVLA